MNSDTLQLLGFAVMLSGAIPMLALAPLALEDPESVFWYIQIAFVILLIGVAIGGYSFYVMTRPANSEIKEGTQ